MGVPHPFWDLLKLLEFELAWPLLLLSGAAWVMWMTRREWPKVFGFGVSCALYVIVFGYRANIPQRYLVTWVMILAFSAVWALPQFVEAIEKLWGLSRRVSERVMGVVLSFVIVFHLGSLWTQWPSTEIRVNSLAQSLVWKELRSRHPKWSGAIPLHYLPWVIEAMSSQSLLDFSEIVWSHVFHGESRILMFQNYHVPTTDLYFLWTPFIEVPVAVSAQAAIAAAEPSGDVSLDVTFYGEIVEDRLANLPLKEVAMADFQAGRWDFIVLSHPLVGYTSLKLSPPYYHVIQKPAAQLTMK